MMLQLAIKRAGKEVAQPRAGRECLALVAGLQRAFAQTVRTARERDQTPAVFPSEIRADAGARRGLRRWRNCAVEIASAQAA